MNSRTSRPRSPTRQMTLTSAARRAGDHAQQRRLADAGAGEDAQALAAAAGHDASSARTPSVTRSVMRGRSSGDGGDAGDRPLRQPVERRRRRRSGCRARRARGRAAASPTATLTLPAGGGDDVARADAVHLAQRHQQGAARRGSRRPRRGCRSRRGGRDRVRRRRPRRPRPPGRSPRRSGRSGRRRGRAGGAGRRRPTASAAAAQTLSRSRELVHEHLAGAGELRRPASRRPRPRAVRTTAPPRPTRRSACTSQCSMPPSSATSVRRAARDQVEVVGVDQDGHALALDEPAQRAAHDVDDPLGLGVQRGAKRLLGDLQRQLDGARARTRGGDALALGGDARRPRPQRRDGGGQLRAALGEAGLRSPPRGRGARRLGLGRPGRPRAPRGGAGAEDGARPAGPPARGARRPPSDDVVLGLAVLAAAADRDRARVLEAADGGDDPALGLLDDRRAAAAAPVSRSSCSISAPRVDMLRKIVSLTSSPTPRRASPRSFWSTSRSSELDVAVAEDDDVVEGEELLADLVGQLAVGLGDRLEHGALGRAAGAVEELGQRVDAARAARTPGSGRWRASGAARARRPRRRPGSCRSICAMRSATSACSSGGSAAEHAWRRASCAARRRRARSSAATRRPGRSTICSGGVRRRKSNGRSSACAVIEPMISSARVGAEQVLEHLAGELRAADRELARAARSARRARRRRASRRLGLDAPQRRPSRPRAPRSRAR